MRLLLIAKHPLAQSSPFFGEGKNGKLREDRGTKYEGESLFLFLWSCADLRNNCRSVLLSSIGRHFSYLRAFLSGGRRRSICARRENRFSWEKSFHFFIGGNWSRITSLIGIWKYIREFISDPTHSGFFKEYWGPRGTKNWKLSYNPKERIIIKTKMRISKLNQFFPTVDDSWPPPPDA